MNRNTVPAGEGNSSEYYYIFGRRLYVEKEEEQEKEEEEKAVADILVHPYNMYMTVLYVIDALHTVYSQEQDSQLCLLWAVHFNVQAYSGYTRYIHVDAATADCRYFVP